MRVRATTAAPPETGADTVVVGLFEGEGVAHDHGGVLQALVDRGEARPAARKLAVAHADGARYVLVGLGACGCTHKESQCNNRAARSQRTNILVHKSCCRGSDESRNVPSCRFWKFLSLVTLQKHR